MHHHHSTTGYSSSRESGSSVQEAASDVSPQVKAELLGATAGLVHVVGDIDGRSRAEDLLQMYTPALTADLHKQEHRLAHNVSYWELFRSCAMLREKGTGGLNLLNRGDATLSSSRAHSHAESSEQALLGTMVGSTGYHWYVTADRAKVPYYICPKAADTVPAALAGVLQELSLHHSSSTGANASSNRKSNSNNNNERVVVNALHDAVSHCFSVQQVLQCVHVFGEFLEEQAARAAAATDDSGSSGSSTQAQACLELDLPLSTHAQAKVAGAAKAAVVRSLGGSGQQEQANEAVQALHDMLQQRLQFEEEHLQQLCSA